LAHIHKGASGVFGGISVTLTPPLNPGAGNPGASSGCVSTTLAILNQIKANPAGFYINVHNGEFPSGAVRGQLF
jgi:hypothetical protein